MDRLKETVSSVMSTYAGRALNGYSYLTTSAEGNLLTIVSVGDVRGERVVDTGLVVRLDGDQIIIERDVNDKPLVDALVQAGIPRKQIVLAYAAEGQKQSQV